MAYVPKGSLNPGAKTGNEGGSRALRSSLRRFPINRSERGHLMADLPIIENVYRCALNWTGAAQTAENVIHIQQDGGSSDSVFAGLNDAQSTHMFESASSSTGVYSVSITPLDGSSVTSDYIAPSTDWNGNTGGNWSPAVAVTIKMLTAIRGRSFRGRLYLPFTADSAQENGSIGGSMAGTMANAWADWLAALADETLVPVVASYKLAVATPIVSILPQLGCSTQRRRQRRVAFP